jgi:hypothetical protein
MRIFTNKQDLQNAIKRYFFETQTEDDISNWNTSQIRDMSYLFSNSPTISISPITLNWDTSNVVNMSYMFASCYQTFILNLNTRNVIDMSFMFHCNFQNITTRL